MALTKSDIVATVHELGFTKKKSVDIIESLLEIIKGTLEKKLITRALEETEGNRTRAARLLEISHPSLLTKIKAYNINL